MSATHLSRAVGILLLVIIGIPLLLLMGGWAWVLASSSPLTLPIANWVPWPVACTTHGCITTYGWIRQAQLAQAFSKSTVSETPTPAVLLTTLIRHHLVEASMVRSPVKAADAKRYREDILHVTSSEQLQQAIPVSLDRYDTYVVIPFLQQEALKQDRHIEATSELYSVLAKERYVLLLPFRLVWDTHKGVVKER